MRACEFAERARRCGCSSVWMRRRPGQRVSTKELKHRVSRLSDVQKHETLMKRMSRSRGSSIASSLELAAHRRPFGLPVSAAPFAHEPPHPIQRPPSPAWLLWATQRCSSWTALTLAIERKAAPWPPACATNHPSFPPLPLSAFTRPRSQPARHHQALRCPRFLFARTCSCQQLMIDAAVLAIKYIFSPSFYTFQSLPVSLQSRGLWAAARSSLVESLKPSTRSRCRLGRANERILRKGPSCHCLPLLHCAVI